MIPAEVILNQTYYVKTNGIGEVKINLLTEFTFTRFSTQFANYEGWALFCDSDIVFLKDVKELFDQADDRYAVMCVQHDYTSKRRNKMDGQKQTQYPKKN